MKFLKKWFYNDLFQTTIVFYPINYNCPKFVIFIKYKGWFKKWLKYDEVFVHHDQGGIEKAQERARKIEKELKIWSKNK
jgi:hypothetical protein